MMLLLSTIIATLVGLASAAIIPRDSGFKVLSQGQVDSTNVYAHIASAVTCPPQTLTYWNCEDCQAVPSFMLYENGGNGQTIPYWLVGYDNQLDSIIVAHQGGEGQNFFTGLANANQGNLTNLDPSIFPNISSSVGVYQPYADIHTQSVPDVLQALSGLVQQYPNADVTVVGYSLGGVLALLDGLLIRMLLSPTTDVKVVTYGMTRVGNDAFAGFVDAMLPGSVKHIHNKRDPYGIVPAIPLGYHQISGEIHIQDSGKWIACPGEDNADPRCIVGTVNSISDADFKFHNGPYNGIMMGCNS